MFVGCVLRSLFTTCIPLFLLLTGYLMSDKKLEKTYYGKCLRTVWIYILASALSATYRLVVAGTAIHLYEFLKSLLNFSGCPYAWYVEMYLGLFMLIPFLNILYHGIPTQGWKIGLLVTLVVLTTLPTFFNVFRFEELNWWISPQSNKEYFKIIPAWWMGIYPITYYFIGNYIHEYGLRIKRTICFTSIVLLMIVTGCFSYWRSTPGIYEWGLWQDWNSWSNVLMGVLVFAFVLNGKEDSKGNKSVIKEKLYSAISKYAFGAYLLSWIAEDVVYHHMPLEAVEIPNRLQYYPIVLIVFIISLLLSACVNMIYDFVRRHVVKRF